MAAQLQFGAGNSTTFGTSGSGSSGTATFTKATLSNMQVGDLLVAWIHDQSATVGTTITAPSGWTRYGATLGTPSWNASRTSGFYYYALQSQTDITNLPANITWTFSITNNRVACVVARATGIDLNNIEDSAATAFSTQGSTTALTLASITTVSPMTLLLAGVHHQNSANTSAPGTTTLLTDFEEHLTDPTGSANTSTGNSGAAMGYRYLTSSGATGSVTANFNNVVSASGGELVSFTADASPAGKAVQYTSATDTLSNAQLYYTSDIDTLSVPTEVRPVPTGYSSVSTMLATTPFYVAHRGGSMDWPEMSLHAYSQSVFWGVSALELSLARTSDGVWFGLHDASLDRTSQNTGGGSGTNLVASSMTWAQVQQYQINYPSVTNVTSLPKPYMRWEEIMAAYYGTHVIFVDPKSAYSHTNELLNMMDAQPNTPTNHFVAKYYGVVGPTDNSSGWPHDSSARGYKGWGYFYEVDAANFAAYQGRWDILGMDYNADQATWTSILSYGKPVIGHVVSSAADATTALNFGAVGLMVSGVQEVITRSA